MLTINDLAELDELTWKSTRQTGNAGAAILRVLKKNNLVNGTPEFDVEFPDYHPGQALPAGKYIIAGYPHGSKAEAELVKCLLKYLPPYFLPRLWESSAFLALDRQVAREELAEARLTRQVTPVRGVNIKVWDERVCSRRYDNAAPLPEGEGRYLLWSHTAYTGDDTLRADLFSSTPPVDHELYYDHYMKTGTSPARTELHFYTPMEDDARFLDLFLFEIDTMRGRFRVSGQPEQA